MKRYFIFLILIIGVLAIYSENLKINQGIKDIYGKNKLLLDIFNCHYNQDNDSISQRQIFERALLMSSVKWSPKSDIPNNMGKFTKGKEVAGLPYSSVKELQKFIGLDVSIYTFLTAVNNPYSLLYTENVAKGQPCYLGGTYNGINCHTFYGTVCSSFTAFCVGENYNYTSFNYRDRLVPNYFLKSDQSIESLEAGDLFWCPGHVALITEVEKDSLGNLQRIRFFESSGTRVYTTDYTPDAFRSKMSGNGNPRKQGYLYKNELVSPSKSKFNDTRYSEIIQSVTDSIIQERIEICTWFGDRPCLGEWDKLMLNFDIKDYSKIIVSLNGESVDTLDITNSGHAIKYDFKDFGIYQARLATDDFISQEFTSFEVIDTRTKYRYDRDGNVEVTFAQDSSPEIVYWVDNTGDQLSFPVAIPEKARKEGKMVIKPVKRRDAILRVIYRGNYGRSINCPDYLIH